MTSHLEQSGAERAGAQALRPQGARVHTFSGERVTSRQSPRPLAAIIAGMHRSGTSALARALSICGLDLPRTLMAANAFNEDGYWESETIKVSNDTLLQALDSAWDDALASRMAREGRYPRAGIDALKAAIRDQFHPERDIVIKDPRISLLFGAWRQALEDLGYEPTLIIPVRHPLEVAASLGKRDGFPILKSAILWLGHLLALERDSRGVPRAFVHYDDLLADWRGCFRRLERLTGLRLRQWTAASEYEIDRFISLDRCHHRYDAGLLATRSDLPAWVGDAYRWALEAAHGETEPATAGLDAIAAQFHATADIYGPLLSFERRRAIEAVEQQGAPAQRTAREVIFSVYSATADAPFDEGTCVRQSRRLTREAQTLSISTPPRSDALTALRLDPPDAPSQILLHSLRVRGMDGALIWQWAGELDVFDHGRGIAAERLSSGAVLIEALNDDPQVPLPVTEALRAHRQVIVELAVSLADAAEVACARMLRENRSEVRELADKVATLNGQIAAIEQASAIAARRQAEASENLAACVGQLRADIQRIQTRNEELAALKSEVKIAIDLAHETRALTVGAEARADSRTLQLSAFLERRLAVLGDDLIAQMRVATEVHERQAAEATQQRDTALAMADSHRQEVAALRLSTSWRLTAPLRAMRRGPSATARALWQTARSVRDALRKRQYGKTYADPAGITHNDNEARMLARSSLFDPDWYLATYADVREAGVDPLSHYLRYGGLEGRAPGPAFDSRWYLGQNPDVAAARMNPLVHYLLAGRREKRAPLPPAPHAPTRFGEHARLMRGARHWKHLTARAALTLDPILPRPLARRLRAAVQANTPRIEDAPRTADPTIHADTLDQLFATAAARGAQYTSLAPEPISVESRVRAIAFYLPQFHPIPENDAWWGKGFTEWTNVSKAAPQFVGHYQPRLPDELGYYDLRVPEVQRRQVELARHYGIHGFCFHYYWFTGRRRLLERPLDQFLAAKDIDFPFCICWANENWTRRWDGMDQEILMEQRHEPHDDVEFIEDLAPILRDPRYIRIDGRPLIIVYRVDILPNSQRTTQTWRDYCRDHGIGDPYLVCAQTFGIKDPRGYAFDAAVEFPPHNNSSGEVTHEQTYINAAFNGRVFSYEHIAKREAKIAWPDYTLFKTVMPSWDNEARKPGRGHAFTGATPALYKTWLAGACHATDARYQRADEKLVFINAWNEWAEGAYLEPDRRFGYGYLDATRQVLETLPSGRRASSQRRVAIVSHDAFPAGAQQIALHLARALGDVLDYEIEFVLLGDGALADEFRRTALVHDLRGADPKGPAARAVAHRLRDRGVATAIANTTVSGLFAETLKDAGLRVVSLVHELPGIVREYGLENHAKAIARRCDAVVFPANHVREGFQQFAHVEPERAIIRPQGLYLKSSPMNDGDSERLSLRKRLGIPAEALIVLGVGYADERKGVDLFLDVAASVCAKRDNVHFVWAGEVKAALAGVVDGRLGKMGQPLRVHFPGRIPHSDIGRFYAGADLYLLTSREDPFPSVVLESLDAALPVVAFEGAGGFEELLRGGCGLLTPHGDVAAMAAGVLDLLDNTIKRAALGKTGRKRIRADFSFRRYAFDIASLADPDLKRVSAIVPNYNYARYLDQRIASIAGQSAPIYEIIALDDASTDDSADTLDRLLANVDIDSELVLSQRNTGSPCRQWLQGVLRARGEIVWIAEADDLCDPHLVRDMLRAFDDAAVVMSYCQSRQMDSEGAITCNDYLDYVADVGGQRWTAAHVVSGSDELASVLSVKNTIPNVSACLFRRDALLKALAENMDEIARYRVAGDWATYAHVLVQGKLAFFPLPLNKHRRHERSITLGSFNAGLLHEILSMQRTVQQRHNPSPEWRARADAYAQELYIQFGLASRTAPHIADSGEFASYFGRAGARPNGYFST